MSLDRARTGSRMELGTPPRCGGLAEEGDGSSNEQGGVTVSGGEEGRVWVDKTIRRGYWMVKGELSLNFFLRCGREKWFGSYTEDHRRHL